MNKKFSTLMASLMLASAFSVSAQTAVEKYEDGKYYMLCDGTKILSVVSNPSTTSSYGELTVVNKSDAVATLTSTRNALWKVTVTEGKAGDAPKYSFVNVATGMTLSVPTPEKNKPETDAAAHVKDWTIGYGDEAKLMISGGYMEWLNGGANSFDGVAQPFYSYINNTDVVYLGINDDDVYVKRASYGDMDDDTNVLNIMPYNAKTINLTADDLNKELIANNEDPTKDSFFKLSFDQDVTEGAENLFAATPLQAVKLYKVTGGGYTTDATKGTGLAPYVRLYSKDNGYLMVDTALHTGSEAMTQLPKFTYVANPDAEGDPIKGNNYSRLSNSANFKFAYEPINDRVLIKVEKYAKRVQNWDGTPVKIEKGVDGNEAYTYWPTGTYIKKANNVSDWTGEVTVSDLTAEGVNQSLISDAYVRLVTLSNVRELTVASGAADGTHKVTTIDVKYDAEWSNPNDLTYGMLTNVKIGEGLMSYVPTTIKSGLYMIQFVKNANNANAAEGNYYVANLGGAFGYAEQAKNQVFDHMPAAQWYVAQQGSISSAPIKISNREFYDNKNLMDLDGDGDVDDPTFVDYQYQAFQGPDGTVFFRGGAFANDTVKFIPVSDASKADTKLGYKYVDEQTSTVETYVFNYLHGLAASSEVGLNTPIAKDSLVRVDETGETIAFRLVPVAVDDSYGKQFAANAGIANLVRNAYYIQAYDEIKFAEDNEPRYLTYDTKSKKYVMSTTPTAYFLKENNCVGDVHYYALVEANLLKVAYADLNADLKPASNEGETVLFYPERFKNMKTTDEAVKTYAENYDASETAFYFYDKNGKQIVTDASENVALYAYQANKDGKIELQIVKKDGAPTKYYYMNAKNAKDGINSTFVSGDINENASYTAHKFITTSYADARVSVDDNTLDLTKAALSDKWEKEIRVSAFAVVENDAPLYRRFNGANGEYGTEANAPLNLKFYRYNNDQEYLFENYSSENSYRDGITDNSISFLGVNNAMQFAENETRSYTMFVDTAYVRNNTRMPQYLIGVKPEVVPGDTIWCNATSAHHHETLADSLACDHTIITPGFVRAMYLFNAQDSIDAKNYDYQGKAAYGAQGYTRLAFKDAVHAMDTLYILNPGVTTEQLIEANFKNDDLFANKIALDNNKHKNVVFQFRLLDEKDNRFLIESEAEKDGAAVLNSKLDHVCVAPTAGGWVKVQNGVPVIARYQDFKEASAQADVFDVNDDIKYDAVDNEEIAVEGVSVVAGNGQVTIMGAAGKNVTITNILGKVVASQVIASDNATIAVPAGIVAVAVEGEAAVKAIVK